MSPFFTSTLSTSVLASMLNTFQEASSPSRLEMMCANAITLGLFVRYGAGDTDDAIDRGYPAAYGGMFSVRTGVPASRINHQAIELGVWELGARMPAGAGEMGERREAVGTVFGFIVLAVAVLPDDRVVALFTLAGNKASGKCNFIGRRGAVVQHAIKLGNTLCRVRFTGNLRPPQQGLSLLNDKRIVHEEQPCCGTVVVKRWALVVSGLAKSKPEKGRAGSGDR